MNVVSCHYLRDRKRAPLASRTANTNAAYVIDEMMHCLIDAKGIGVVIAENRHICEDNTARTGKSLCRTFDNELCSTSIHGPQGSRMDIVTLSSLDLDVIRSVCMDSYVDNCGTGIRGALEWCMWNIIVC